MRSGAGSASDRGNTVRAQRSTTTWTRSGTTRRGTIPLLTNLHVIMMYEPADVAGPSYPSRLSRRASDSFSLRLHPRNGFRVASSPVSAPANEANWSQETITHSKLSSASTAKSIGYSDESEEDNGTQRFHVKHESRTPSPPPFLSSRRHSMTTVKQEDGNDTLAYTSLPSSPISGTPVSPTPPIYDELRHQVHSDLRSAPFSLWDYLQEELLATDFDSHQELKWERVSNFLSIPLAIEKVSASIVSWHLVLLSLSADAWIRLHSLLRFISPYLHNFTNSLCPRCL